MPVEICREVVRAFWREFGLGAADKTLEELHYSIPSAKVMTGAAIVAGQASYRVQERAILCKSLLFKAVFLNNTSPDSNESRPGPTC